MPGSPGMKGDIGEIGPQGMKGHRGLMGLQGPPGLQASLSTLYTSLPFSKPDATTVEQQPTSYDISAYESI